MTDVHGIVSSALEEVERALKLVGKIRVVQVQNAEHRDFLKATALSWFMKHRPALTALVSSELLASIDAPYRAALEATDRKAAKSTYSSAFKNAKVALIAARNGALVAAPVSRSGDVPPSFAPLASDAQMQAILADRWDECTRCLNAGAPLAATVMMGGLLEALLVSRANKLANKSVLFQAKAAPVDKQTKKPLDLRQWTLAPYVDVGHELGWISRSAKDVAAILRDYRNYVHPEKQRSHGVTLTGDDAAMLWEVTKSLSRELLLMKDAI